MDMRILDKILGNFILKFMHLSPSEADKLHLFQVATLAQKRLAQSLPLNHTEACALLACFILDTIRLDASASVSQLMSLGRKVLGRRLVLPSVVHTLKEVQVEGTFVDGTKLVAVHWPICTDDGDLSLALRGSFLPLSSIDSFPPLNVALLLPENAPGAYNLLAEPIALFPGRTRTLLTVTNDGDRPIQVGSHYHFIETNRLLRFDRKLSRGKHLDIPAGTAVRFEPGETKDVTLVDIAGNKRISGGNSIINDSDISDDQLLEKLKERGFSNMTQQKSSAVPKACTISRQQYAAAYGPTTGDQVRLGDSCLWIQIEKDFTEYGDECVFGGGKVIREGQGQCNFSIGSVLDLVITNCLIVDYTGIFKADIGIKNGLILGIGKAGNPNVMQNVTPQMVIGAETEVLAGEGKIITAGGVDTHIHFICPQICDVALSSGLTTLMGGGTGPNTGTCATTCTPGANNIRFMLQATDGLPLNFGFTGKGNCSTLGPLRHQVQAGAVGLKLHEDYGTTPATIDACLTVCDEFDVQCTIHTDTLNESGFVEDTISAFKNRTIHAYHSEGAGGGHAPDIIRVCSLPNVIPSSTNPTRPFTVNTIDEHLDMLMVCHHLDSNIPEDIAFAESRIRGETIGAEDILHDLGAISIISSDSQAMGRVGEVITRTWQTADKMKKVRGHLKITEDNVADNDRVKRFISKYTINPAIAHGVSNLIGSIEVGKLADIVLWSSEFFGTKPEIVIKGGFIAFAQMGDANASIPTPQPVIGRKMFGAFPSAAQSSFKPHLLKTPQEYSVASQSPCISFVSQYAADNNVAEAYGLKKRVEAVTNCRKITKKDMKWNDATPDIKVNPETYQVHIDGVLASMEPATSVCMSRNNYIF